MVRTNELGRGWSWRARTVCRQSSGEHLVPQRACTFHLRLTCSTCFRCCGVSLWNCKNTLLSTWFRNTRMMIPGLNASTSAAPTTPFTYLVATNHTWHVLGWAKTCADGGPAGASRRSSSYCHCRCRWWCWWRPKKRWSYRQQIEYSFAIRRQHHLWTQAFTGLCEST